MRRSPILAFGLLMAGLAGLAAAPPAWAQFGHNKVTYGDFKWTIYASPHFDVYYYFDDDRLLQQLVSEAESAYLQVSRTLDHELRIRIPLILYRNHADFEQTNITLAELPEGVGAFAEPIQNRMVVPIDEPSDKRFALLKHELTHIFEFDILYGGSLRRALRGNAPLWLMEGLASYVGDDEDSFDQMVIRDAVVNNIVPPIAALNVLTFLTYRYGNAVFSYIEDKYGAEGVRTFLFEFRKQLVGGNVEKAFKDAFGLDLDQFDREFARWLRQRYLPILTSKRAPAEYGPEIGVTKPGRYTFSPSLSPSGELIAALSTPGLELDAVVLSAKDGKQVRNLTKGFTTRFEDIIAGAFEAKRDITWSPDGDRVAFFVRRENDRPLMIFDVTNGRIEDRIKFAPITNENSPAFSPDGKWIAFSGNRDGVWDIFLYNLETKELVNATQDEYYDLNPSWSPDGKSVLYNRRIGEFPKIFMVEVGAPERKTQLTAGAASDVQPAWSRDGKTIYFSSDRGLYGVYNLHRLDLASGGIERLTDLVGGAFGPIELLPDSDRIPQLAYAAFDGGTFRVYRMKLAGPAMEEAIKVGRAEPQTSPHAPSRRKVRTGAQPPASSAPPRPQSSLHPSRWDSGAIPASFGWQAAPTPPETPPTPPLPANEEPPGDLLRQDEGDTDLEPFTPPLDLTLDPDKKKKYRAKWSIEMPDLFVGVTNSGDFLTNFVFNFSDLLGDQRASFTASSVASYTNFDLTYFNLGGRWDWGARLFDYRDFYVASTGSQTEVINQRQRYSAISGFAQYPFNRYLRFETTAGYAERRYDQPFFDPFTGQTEFVTSASNFPYLSVGLVYDSVRYQSFGPYQGKQVSLTVTGVTFTGGDDQGEDVIQYSLDTRFYQGITQRGLLALRMIGVFQTGNAGSIYAIGGINEIRGYEYNQFFGDNYILANLELRFPLLDSMRLPFGLNLAPVRGFLFIDFGTTWFGDQDYVVFDEETGLPTGLARGKATFSNKLGTYRQYQATLDGRWKDYHGSVGAGFTVPVLGLPMTWAFSRVYNGDGFDPLSGSFYIIINW